MTTPVAHAIIKQRAGNDRRNQCALLFGSDPFPVSSRSIARFDTRAAVKRTVDCRHPDSSCTRLQHGNVIRGTSRTEMLHTYVRIHYSGHVTKYTMSCTTASALLALATHENARIIVAGCWPKRAHPRVSLPLLKIPHTHLRIARDSCSKSGDTLLRYEYVTLSVNNRVDLLNDYIKRIILRRIISLYSTKLRKHQVSGRSRNHFFHLILFYIFRIYIK